MGIKNSRDHVLLSLTISFYSDYLDTMAQISPSLVWAVRRDNHAQIMKRPNCRTFSKEAFNLKKLHSPKYNGFINPSAVDVVPNKGKGVVVCQKLKRNYFKPGASIRRRPQNCSARKAFLHIRKLTLKQKCRPDLEMTALARASTIIRSQERTSGVVKKRPHLLRVAKWRKRDARRKARDAKKTKKPKKQSKKSAKTKA